MKNPSREYSQLFRSLTETVEAFLQELKRHNLHDKATEKWTVKDVLCHIAFWHNYYAENYSSLAADEKPDVFVSKGGSTRNQKGVDKLNRKSKKYLITLLKESQKSLYESIVLKKVPQMTYVAPKIYSTKEFLEVVIGHIKRHTIQVRRAKVVPDKVHHL